MGVHTGRVVGVSEGKGEDMGEGVGEGAVVGVALREGVAAIKGGVRKAVSW